MVREVAVTIYRGDTLEISSPEERAWLYADRYNDGAVEINVGWEGDANSVTLSPEEVRALIEYLEGE